MLPASYAALPRLIIFNSSDPLLHVRTPLLERTSLKYKLFARSLILRTCVKSTRCRSGGDVWHQHVDKSGVLCRPDIEEIHSGERTVHSPFLVVGNAIVSFARLRRYLIARDAVHCDCTCRTESEV
jgi:hypothetical protein